MLADDGDFSFSSGNSTELILTGLADNSLRLWMGLEGAAKKNIVSIDNEKKFNKILH